MTLAIDPNPFDFHPMERSVNQSAVRVSTVWTSFIILGLYLATAAGNVTHRQLFIDQPIKLPVLNIDLPIAGFFLLAPILFVTFHAYVLIQVLLLARTSATYNDTIRHAVLVESARERLRHRLANTLFAQLFAGSSREREGPLGLILRLIAWLTLAVGPLLVLLTFQVQFLAYHSFFITWAHRLTILSDFLIVLLLWPAVLDNGRDIRWSQLWRNKPGLALLCVATLLSVIGLSFPGELQARYVRYSFDIHDGTFIWPADGCRSGNFLSAFLPNAFDYLSLPREQFVDEDKLAKIDNSIRARQLVPTDGPRSHVLRDRDLQCVDLEAADLRRADFANVTMTEANLSRADFQGSMFDNSDLTGSYLANANFSESSFNSAILTRSFGLKTKFRGALLDHVDLRNAHLQWAELDDAVITYADLSAVNLEGAFLRGTVFVASKLQAADLSNADARAANFVSAALNGAKLDGAALQGSRFGVADQGSIPLPSAELLGASLTDTNLQGADMSGVLLRGANLENAYVNLTRFVRPFVSRAKAPQCDDAQVVDPQFGSERIRRVGSDEFELNAEGLDRIIEEVADTGDEGTSAVRERIRDAISAMRGRINLEPSDNTDADKVTWQACAKKAIADDDYDRQLAQYLVELACSDAESDRKFILEGIIGSRLPWENWQPSEVFLVTFLGGIFGIDGKICPAVDQLRFESKERLRKLRPWLDRARESTAPSHP